MVPVQLVAVGAGLLLALALALTLLVTAWRRRPWPRERLRQAWALVGLIVAVRLPYQWIAIDAFDLSVAFDDDTHPIVARYLSRSATPWLVASTVASGLAGAVLHLASAGVAQTHPEPAYRRPQPEGWGAALLLGAVLAVAGTQWVEAPELALHPSLRTDRALRLFWVASHATGAAIATELVWRGALFGLLRQRLPPLAAAGLVVAGSTGAAAIGGAGPAFTVGSLALHTTLTGLAYRWGATSSTLAGLVATVGAAVWVALETP